MAELRFIILAARLRVALNRANMPTRSDTRYTIFGEVGNTTATLDLLTVVTLNVDNKIRIEHYQSKLPAFANQFRNIGETER